MKYTNLVLSLAEKSMAKDHKHGAVCIIGGRIASIGYNTSSYPHCIKVQERPCYI